MLYIYIHISVHNDAYMYMLAGWKPRARACSCVHFLKTVKVVGWGGGVGEWANNVLPDYNTYTMLRCCTFSWTSTHAPCYPAVRSHALLHICSHGLLQIRHATLLHVLMDFCTYAMLRCCTFSCTSTRHTPCYAAVRFYGLLHIRHATLLYVLMHFYTCHATLLYVLMDFYTYAMLRCCTFSCTSTRHTPCYAAVRFYGLLHIRHATLLYVLMHFYTCHATLLYVLMDFYTYAMLHCCTFSCTSTRHTPCYAAVRFYGLLHIRHATLLYVLMHFYKYTMLCCCTFSWTSAYTPCYAAVRSHALLHDIRHATLLYVFMDFCTYVMLRCCTFSCTSTHAMLRCCTFSWTSTHTPCYTAVRSHALLQIRHATLQW